MSKQKKESIQTITVKTLLAILLFTGMGTIIIGGGYIIMKYTLFETEEILATTNKLKYKQGEIVEITIRNNFNKEQGIYFSDPFVEKFNHLELENNWEPVKQIWCPCQSHCYEEKVSNIIEANGQLKYQWDQTESQCTNNPAWYNRKEISSQVEPSKYRFRIEVDKIGIIYSNEFIITKEDIDQRKVYKNEEYGFELKYPEDWYQKDNYQGTDIILLNTDKEIVRGGIRPDDYWLSESPYKKNPKYIDNWVGIGINVYQKPVNFNWNNWIKDEFPVVEKYENLDYDNLNNGLKGIKVEKLSGIFYGNPNIFLEGENKIFNIRFFSVFPFDIDNDGLNYFEQVVSTFKFIDQDESSASNGQTYRNEEFGFEFNFPITWEDYIEKPKENKISVNRDTFKEYSYQSIYFLHPQKISEKGMSGEVGFIIGIFDKENWLISEGWKKIGENDRYVFGSSPSNSGAPDDMLERYKEISSITSTFKFINSVNRNDTECISANCVIEECIENNNKECTSREIEYYNPIIESKARELQSKYPEFNCGWSCSKMYGNDCQLFCIKK